MGLVGTKIKHQNMDMCLWKRDLGLVPLMKKTEDLPTHLEEYSGHDDRPDGGGGGDHIGVRCFKEIGQNLLLSIFAQEYLCKCENTYFILQKKYLCIYEDSFGMKILRDDCVNQLQFF